MKISRGLALRLAITFVIVICGMIVFETTKQLFWPAISIWQSHTVTICFSGIISLLSGYLVFRQSDFKNQRIVEELAQRKRIDEQLKLSEEDLRTTLNSIGDAVIATDSLGKISRMNPVAEKLTGWTFNDARGRPLEDVFNIRREGSNEKVDSPVQKVLRDGTVVGLANHTELIRRDGSVIPIADSAAPIRKDSGGISGVVLVFRDQTDERKAGRELTVAEARFRALIEHAPEAIVVFDCETGKFIDCNTNATALFALDRNALLEKGPIDLSPPAQPNGRASHEVVQEYLGKAIAGEIPVFSWTHKNATGKEIECEVRLIRLPSETRKLIRGSITDVTQRRKLEAHIGQWQKIESIGRLAGGVAHDFNNLLTSVIGFAELARARPGDPAFVKKSLERILESSNRGATLTQQLLAFARKKMVRPEMLDLNKIVLQMEPLLRRLIGEDIELIFNAGADLGHVSVDLGSIEQVIMSLAVNSRDAMPRGGKLILESSVVTLDASYAAENPDVTPGTYVRLTVSDSGVGMSRETLSRAFEPFFTTKGVGKGTGLGLAMCYGIIKQAGGHISIYSELEKGTSVKVYLPRMASVEPAAAASAEPLGLHNGKETILVVEDDALIRQFADELLKDLGYDVLTAADGAQAIQVAERAGRPIHLMLTDVVMPVMGGSELAERMKSKYPELVVLFSSGYTDDAVVRHGVLMDDANFIQKPYNPTTLTHKIRILLDKK